MTAKVVVITGASGGIGAALARQLAGRGDKLVLGARREAELKQVAQECGAGTLAVVADVTRRAEVERLRDEALRAFGRVDVWVNNAGRGIGRQVLDLTDGDFDEMMAVNAKSALYGMQAILPYFKERGEGHLINVSSALGRIPFAPYRSAYSAAKAALNSLTTNLRLDLRREYPNIRVSLVMPPTVSSDFARNALHGTPVPPGGPRPGIVVQTPAEVAAAIVALIDHPQSELYTSPETAETVARYYADIYAFEEGMGR
ncbi:MAG: SDR family oxidoreductase [Anaerolineales bacterium]|jgi:short-subunit dehydrogenase